MRTDISGASRLYPRWGHQASIFQARRPAFWLLAILLVLTGLLTLDEQLYFLDRAPGGVVLSWVLLTFYLLPVALVIYRVDAYEREPLSLVAGAFGWGAVVAPSLAGIGNEGWGRAVLELAGPRFAAAWSDAITAPIVEETLKVLGVVVIALIARSEVDDMLDGFVYGAMIGLGFTVVEDVFYFIAIFGGSPGAVVAGFFLRVLSGGLYGHVLYTGLAGMGIAWFLTHRGSLILRAAPAAGLFATAVAAHALWNSPLLDLVPDTRAAWVLLVLPFALAVKGLPFLIFLVILIRLARRQELRWLRALAACEVPGPWISASDVAFLEQPRRRREERRAIRRARGRAAARALNRLRREQMSLLMVRSRVSADDDADLIRQRERCRALREALLGGD